MRSLTRVHSDALRKASRRPREPCAIERLDQIVDGVHFERAQCMFVVRRHEHDERHPVDTDLRDHSESIERRHLYIEKHDVRRERRNRGNGLAPVACFADDLERWIFSEQRANTAAGEHFVVDNERADGH